MLCLSGFELYQSVELMFEGRRCFNLVPSVLSYTSLRSKLRRVGERTWERRFGVVCDKNDLQL